MIGSNWRCAATAFSLAPLLVFAAPERSAASEWWWTASQTRAVNFIDYASIAETNHPYAGSVRRAWVAAYGYDPKFPQWKHSKEMIYYNCANKTFAKKSYAAYTKSNEVMMSGTYQDFEMVFTPAIPDTVGEANLNFVCAVEIGAPSPGPFKIGSMTYSHVADVEGYARDYAPKAPGTSSLMPPGPAN